MKTKVIVAIICITVLEGIALWKGINGTVFATVVAALAVLGGYTLGQLKKPK